jgi:hypothetical protein
MKKFTLAMAMLVATITFAQESQVTLINKIGATPLTEYSVNYDRSSDSYSYPGCCTNNDGLTISTFDGLTVVSITRTHESGKTKTSEYYSDEEAFAVTFVSGYIRGNAEQKERLKVLDKSSESRLVTLNNWIYLLKWKSNTNWIIEKVYGLGETKGFKKLKVAAGASKKMTAANHVETLTEYFEKAFKKQSENLVIWNKSNTDKIQRRNDNELVLNAEINGRNEDFWNSPEGKEIKKRNEMFDKIHAEEAKEQVTLIYTGSKTVTFGYERNSWGGSKGAGQKSVLDCKRDIYVYRDGKRAEMVSPAGSNCEGTVEVP